MIDDQAFAVALGLRATAHKLPKRESFPRLEHDRVHQRSRDSQTDGLVLLQMQVDVAELPPDQGVVAIHHHRKHFSRPLPGKGCGRKEVLQAATQDHAVNGKTVRQRRYFTKQFSRQLLPQQQAPQGGHRAGEPASPTSFQTLDNPRKSQAPNGHVQQSIQHDLAA